ncbi:MAG: hypothetical protein CSA11_07580 [Chloroflexi bacterium]|nr:MAG: hypothetical protein CSA11_07580 [Chloroflexota bacterium]
MRFGSCSCGIAKTETQAAEIVFETLNGRVIGTELCAIYGVEAEVLKLLGKSTSNELFLRIPVPHVSST